MTDTYKTPLEMYLASLSPLQILAPSPDFDEEFTLFAEWMRRYYFNDYVAMTKSQTDALKRSYIEMHRNNISAIKRDSYMEYQEASHVFVGRVKTIIKSFVCDFILNEDPKVHFEATLRKAGYEPFDVYASAWKYRLFKDIYVFEWNHHLNVTKKLFRSN